MIDITDRQDGQFWVELKRVRPGENIVYYVGGFCGGVHKQDAAEAHKQGLVALIQKKKGPGTYYYIAQKNKPKG